MRNEIARLADRLSLFEQELRILIGRMPAGGARNEIEKLSDELADACHMEDRVPVEHVRKIEEKLRALAERLPTEKEVMQIECPELASTARQQPVAPPPSGMGGGAITRLLRYHPGDYPGTASADGTIVEYDDAIAYAEQYAAARVAAETAALRRERDEARAKAERLRKDAKRYRLLRDATHHAFVTRCIGGATIPRFEGDALDRLTDAILADRGGES